MQLKQPSSGSAHRFWKLRVQSALKLSAAQGGDRFSRSSHSSSTVRADGPLGFSCLLWPHVFPHSLVWDDHSGTGEAWVTLQSHHKVNHSVSPLYKKSCFGMGLGIEGTVLPLAKGCRQELTCKQLMCWQCLPVCKETENIKLIPTVNQCPVSLIRFAYISK